MKKILLYLSGLIAGFINGILGTGGGMLVVPVLEKAGVKTKNAHATAISVILPFTIVSVFFYFKSGAIDVKATLYLSAAGMVGGFIGARLLSKVPRKILKIIFGLIMIYMGIKMLRR